MSESTGSKMQEQVETEESFADKATKKYASKQQQSSSKKSDESSAAEKFPDIKSNPFHQIIVQSEDSPEAKKEAVAKALSYDKAKSKTENEERISDFETFKEYLMAYRKDMSKEIIRLSDTDAFSELQSVLNDMNSSLLDFEEKLTPLINIIDAVHRLNMESDGQMYDVFKEIQEDKAEEERIARLREEQEAKLQEYGDEIKRLTGNIAALREEKSFFGFGNTKKSALQEIAKIKVSIDDITSDIGQLRTEIEANQYNRETKFGDFINEKQQLRELLDITSDEHKERQEALISAALTYVNTTEKKSGEVLEHMRQIKEQAKGVSDVNGNMKKIFAIVSDAIKDSEESNKDLTQEFQAAADNETSLEKLSREESLESINAHVESLNATKVDTLSTLGELQQEGMNIKSLRDTNTQQINHMRKINSSGTAGIASRLSTVLTAVSSAALNESRVATQNTLNMMTAKTDAIAQNEAIQNATNIHLQNDELAKAIEGLQTYKDISDQATKITKAGLEEQKELQKEMEQTAKDLGAAVKKAKGVASDVMQNEGDGESANDEPSSGNKKDDSSSKFDMLGNV